MKVEDREKLETVRTPAERQADRDRKRLEQRRKQRKSSDQARARERVKRARRLEQNAADRVNRTEKALNRAKRGHVDAERTLTQAYSHARAVGLNLEEEAEG